MAAAAPLADDSKHDRLDELETSPELHHAHNGHDGGEGQKPAVAMEEAAGMQAPEFLRHMSMEDRLEMEKRLRWKIDLRLMPAVIIMYIMNYIDRNNIAATRLADIEKDIPLTSSEFQASQPSFDMKPRPELLTGKRLIRDIDGCYYVLMQIPSNLFLNKTGKPAIYLPTCMIVWGAISAATAGCKTVGGLYAIRFFLGFIEAAYFPGCLYYLSCWYTRKELGLRTAILYSGSLLSGAFSGLIAAGITSGMNGSGGLRAWKWLFIIEGAVTIAIAVICYFVLPNFPRTTSWLTEEERLLAAWRLAEDIGEDDWVDSKHQTFWQGAKMAFSDVKTYVLLVLLFGCVASGSVTNFFPTVVATLNYGNVETLLLTSPPYVLAVITSYANAYHADRTGERYFHIVLPLCVSVVAFILAACTTATAPRYVAMMLMVPGVYTGYVVALAWISNTLPRPPAKRAAALAFINAVSNCSSIYASYMYPNSAKPRFAVAFAVNCVTSVIAIAAATVLRFMLVRLNRKLEQGIFVEGAINAAPGQAAQHGFRFKV